MKCKGKDCTVRNMTKNEAKLGAGYCYCCAAERRNKRPAQIQIMLSTYVSVPETQVSPYTLWDSFADIKRHFGQEAVIQQTKDKMFVRHKDGSILEYSLVKR